MAFLKSFLCVALALSANAAVTKKAACSSYVLVNARGTGEPQGESIGFVNMNNQVLAKIPGGSIYNVVYPAAANQNSTAGTADIVREVNAVLATNPATCFILEGYSQGAAATVNAMPKLTGAAFKAVKGVVLLGDPEHKAGLACNVDQNGGNTTKDAVGIEYFEGHIPAKWVSKSLDICWLGDGVCDIQSGIGITPEHLEYPGSTKVQNMGASYIESKL